MPNYIVKKDYVAKKRGASSEILDLKKGDFISGKTSSVVRYSELVPVVETDNGFIIPTSLLDKYVPDKKKVDALLETKEAVASVASRSYNTDLFQFSDSQLKIAGYGALAGFAYALSSGKSMLWSTVIGAAVGGVGVKLYQRVKKSK